MTPITSVQEFGAFLLRAHRVGALYPVALYASYLTLVIGAGLVSLLFNPRFGFGEIGALALAFVVLSAVVSPRGIARGLAGAGLGVLFGTVGINAITGDVRFVFGQPVLWEGLPVRAVLTGLFVVPWALSLLRPATDSPRTLQVFSVASGSIIIPVALLTSVIHWNTWLALPVIGVFAGIGLIMKHYSWPRFPLLAGVVLSPIIEGNFLSALNVVEPVTIGSFESAAFGVLLHPFAIALAVLILVVAILSYRFARGTETPSAGYRADADLRGTVLLVAVTACLAIAFLGWLALVLGIALLVLAAHLPHTAEQNGGFVRRALSRLTLPGMREAAPMLGTGVAALAILSAVDGVEWGVAALAATLSFVLVRDARTRPNPGAAGVAFAGVGLLIVVKLSTGSLAATTTLGVGSVGLSPVLNLLGLILGLLVFAIDRLVAILLTWSLIWPVLPDDSAISLLTFSTHMTGVALLSLSLVLSAVRPAGNMQGRPLLRVLGSWQMLTSLVVMVLTLEAVHTIVS